MTTSVLGIKFNHDPLSSRTSAINIRKDFYNPVLVPEWRRGMTQPGESPAAYAIDEVDPAALAIEAAFFTDDFAGGSVEVRTTTPGGAALPTWIQDQLTSLLFYAPLLYFQIRNYLDTWFMVAAEARSDVLGNVPPTTVHFDAAGASDFVRLPLRNVDIRNVGVGAHQVTWQWEARAHAGQPWTPIAITEHKIYTVVATPTLPWRQQPFIRGNTQLPWADVLDRACLWAQGARTVDSAAERIAQAVYDLGGLFRYGCEVGAVTVYSDPLFNCTMFLERLDGRLGRGPFVNCSDCATIVSTFANALGADLTQGQMRDPLRGFPVNVIRAIGTGVPQVPCGLGLFAYHEVAWTGRAGTRDRVYDACLEVNRNAPFGLFAGVVPAGLPFGEPGEGGYRDKLATPSGRDLCQPQPQLAKRRAVI